MKRKLLVSAMLLISCGCSTMNNTEAGLAGGAIAGGVLGTIVGAACRNPLAGAAIGAGAGAAIGGLSGAAEDNREKKIEQAHNAAVAAAEQARTSPPTLEEIISMTKSGVSDTVIINQIRASRTAYKLESDHLNYLTANGVSPAVITELQNSGRQVLINGGSPVVYAPAPYYYDPYYRPPVVLGVGYYHPYRHW